MNPSGPTFPKKPSIHDQLRSMSNNLNSGTFPAEKEVKDLKSSADRYLLKKSTPETVKTEMKKVTTSADDFLAALNSDEDYPAVSDESVKDIDNALDFYEKRKESGPLRHNIVKTTMRVGGEMRPKSKQIEADLKSLEKKNKKTEEGKVRALEANNRLMLEVMDSENIMQRNREEIKRLRSELESTTFDKKNLLEKLDQAEKDLKDYEAEIKKATRAISEMSAAATNDITREDNFISFKEAEAIRNKLVGDFKEKLLTIKSVKELDEYVTLQYATLRNIISERGLTGDDARSFYNDMLNGRIKNLDGRLGASFNFLLESKRYQLNSAAFRSGREEKKETEKQGTKKPFDKKIKKEPIDVDDAYMDWKYSKQNDIPEEIADYNRKKAAGFDPDKRPATENAEEKSETEEDLHNDPDYQYAFRNGKTTAEIFNEIIRKLLEGITLTAKEKLISVIIAEQINAVLNININGGKPPTHPKPPKDPGISKESKPKKPKITEADMWEATEKVRLEGNNDLDKSTDKYEEDLRREKEKSSEIRKKLYDSFRNIGSFSARQEKWRKILEEDVFVTSEPVNPVPPVPPTDPATPVSPIEPTPAPPYYPDEPTNVGPNTEKLKSKFGWPKIKSMIVALPFVLLAASAGFPGEDTEMKNNRAIGELIQAQNIKNGISSPDYNFKDGSKYDPKTNTFTKTSNGTYEGVYKSSDSVKTAPENLIKTPETKKEETKTSNVEQNTKDLAGGDNKSAEVKKTENGVIYKIADYGVKGFSQDGIEYISNPERKSKERMNNFCNLKGAEAKAYLGFNSLQDAATACLHQLWKYQTGNNKVGLSAESTLEQMIGKYANLDKVVREDAYENYIRIIQKTFKESGQKVDENTKLKDVNMTTMLEAISIAENKFYVFNAKTMVVEMKPGVKKEVLSSAGNIMSNGVHGDSFDYNFASYKLNPDNFKSNKA